MENGTNIDLRKKQISDLVKKHYFANDFLKDKPLNKFIEKTIEKFLYTEISIEEIDKKIIEAINRKKEQMQSDISSTSTGERHVDSELDNTKIAINIDDEIKKKNVDLDNMLDKIDDEKSSIIESSKENPKVFTLSNQNYQNPSNHNNESGYASTLGVSTISLIAFTLIMILYVLLLIFF